MEVLRDSPEQWLITYTCYPFEVGRGEVTLTRVIETEPSLWWRSKKWQDSIGSHMKCIINMVHYIGKPL